MALQVVLGRTIIHMEVTVLMVEMIQREKAEIFPERETDLNSTGKLGMERLDQLS